MSEIVKEFKAKPQEYLDDPKKFFQMVSDKIDMKKTSPKITLLVILAYFGNLYYLTHKHDEFVAMLMDFAEMAASSAKETKELG